MAKLERRWDFSLSEEERSLFKNVVHLFYSNKQCAEFVYTYLYESDMCIRRIDPHFSHACQKCEEAYSPLYIGVGLKVYLSRNKVVARNLTKGSHGVVTNIYYNKDDNKKVEFITVKFENYTGLALDDQRVAVGIQQDKLFCIHLKKKLTVSFFPLQPSIGMTIYKSQGKTYEHIEICFAKCRNFYPQIYTALSRCFKLENIMICSEKPLCTYFKVNQMPHYKNMNHVYIFTDFYFKI